MARKLFAMRPWRAQGVVSDEPLKRRSQTTEGPFFVIDTDSYPCCTR